MAEEAIEKAIELKGLQASGSQTSSIGLWGSQGYHAGLKERLFDRLKSKFGSFGDEDLMQVKRLGLGNQASMMCVYVFQTASSTLIDTTAGHSL